jgi:hypothetical protein
MGMRTRIFPLLTLASVFALTSMMEVRAFGPYTNPYNGVAVVKTGKKQGSLSAVANATTTDGTNATVSLAGDGPKDTSVSVQLTFDSNGKSSLTLMAKVLADPSKTVNGLPIPVGKKVVVKLKATGTYTVVDSTTTTFVLSGNKGHNGGSNLTGTLVADTSGNLSLTFQSGFKQFVPGLGRRIQLSFTGTTSL